MPSGSCVCGKQKFEYDTTVMKAVCHCLTCRKLTGSTFATTVLVPDANFKTASDGSPKISSTVHESGMRLTFYSCDSCPSTLYKTATGFPGVTVVFTGALDGKDDIVDEGKPMAEFWTKYRVPWLKPIEGTMQFEEFPPAN